MRGTRVVPGVAAGLALYALAACSPEGTLTAPPDPAFPAFDIVESETAEVRVCMGVALDDPELADEYAGRPFSFNYRVDGGSPIGFTAFAAIALAECPELATVLFIPGPASSITITQENAPGFELESLVFTGGGPCEVTGSVDMDSRSATIDLCGPGSLATVFFKSGVTDEPDDPKKPKKKKKKSKKERWDWWDKWDPWDKWEKWNPWEPWDRWKKKDKKDKHDRKDKDNDKHDKKDKHDRNDRNDKWDPWDRNDRWDDRDRDGKSSKQQACTPGYWKQKHHFDSWKHYSPRQKIGDVFDGRKTKYSRTTLDDALGFGGGSGIDGAEKILLRAGVAALLNASNPDLRYPLTRNEVVSMVNSALRSDDRKTILKVAEKLDDYNNLGCPLR